MISEKVEYLSPAIDILKAEGWHGRDMQNLIHWMAYLAPSRKRQKRG
jgi:hypothetical protein